MSYTTADLRALGAISVDKTAIVYAFLSLAGEPCAPDRVLLADGERRRAERFVRSADGNRYVLAHAALRLFLARCLNVEPETLVFESGDHGKPHLASRSMPLEFNLSHSGEVGLLCAAHGRSVGVDVERVRALPDALGIADAYFAAAETRRLRRLPEAELPAEFFRYWTRKEATIKASGEGLSRALDSFEVGPTPGSVTAVTRSGVGSGNGEELVVRDLPAPEGYAAAGAVMTAEGMSVAWKGL